LPHSIAKFEERFDAQHNKHNKEYEICDRPGCGILSPEYVNVIINPDSDKTQDMCFAYKLETNMLKSLGLDVGSPVPNFESKRKELSELQLKYSQRASLIPDSFDDRLKANPKTINLQEEVKGINEENIKIRNKLAEKEKLLYENEVKIQQLNGALHDQRTRLFGNV